MKITFPLLFVVLLITGWSFQLLHLLGITLASQQETAPIQQFSATQAKAPKTHQWKTSAYPCERQLEGGLFKSQDKEDRELLQWFGNLCNGSYVEMGGLDGVLHSNTHVYNKGLDWKGVLVELGPQNFAKLQRNRPNELATVHAAVCDKRQTLHFLENRSVGGIWEFMAPSFRNHWHKGLTLKDTTPVECRPLNDIFKDTVGDHFYFDFFTLDIEGAEYQAITTLDFSNVGFGVVVVEADNHNERKNLALRMLLESNGYRFLKEDKRSYWFINVEFGSIYKDLVH